MSHIPGVKPDLKEEWKNADRTEKSILITAAFLFGAMVVIGLFLYALGEIDTPEKVELLLRTLLLAVFAGMGYVMSHYKLKQLEIYEKNQRVKKGLRYDWDVEDLDELEERVRKLEEKE